MKKLLLTGIAALFLATGTAHASAHLTFLECGPHLIVNIWAAPEGGGPIDKWLLVLDRNRGWNEGGNQKRVPRRMIKLKDQGYYYRRQKCQYISRGAVKETEEPVPPWTENKEPDPWDHIQPPKGDGWEDIKK